VSHIAAAATQDMLCRNDSPIWRSLRMAKACMDDLTNEIAKAGDYSRQAVEIRKATRGGEALILLREIYDACKERHPHKGRVLRKAQWDKIAKLMEKS